MPRERAIRLRSPRPAPAVPRSDSTGQRILDAAVRVLEKHSVSQLTVHAVAHEAGISDRTVFRYYPTREVFLDAIAAAVARKLSLPDPPSTLRELVETPRVLYSAFEAHRELARAALHSEIFDRMRLAQARRRWQAVRALVDAHASKRSERERRIAAANIRYHLSATAWHYYRVYFRFTLEETIACGETAIRQSLAGLGVRCPRRDRERGSGSRRGKEATRTDVRDEARTEAGRRPRKGA